MSILMKIRLEDDLKTSITSKIFFFGKFAAFKILKRPTRVSNGKFPIKIYRKFP